MSGLKTAAEELAAALDEVGPGLLVVLTGAGVSLASGLDTFRGTDPGAIWARDVTEIATRAYFERDPVGWWRWFLARFDRVLTARPNPAHHALAALERWQLGRGGRFLLVTQNIDLLHEAAGSRQLVKVHGSADRVRCTRPACPNAAPRGSLPVAGIDLRPLAEDPRPVHLPRCPDCGALLRPHALLFDEVYSDHADYGFEQVTGAFGTMAALVFAGTSFSVGITEMALTAAWSRGLDAVSIDPSGRAPRGVRGLGFAAEQLLPPVCRELGIETGPRPEIC